MEEAGIKNKDEFYIDSAKTVKIYELILDKSIDFKDIKDDEVEKDVLESDKFLKYIKEFELKIDQTKDTINSITKAIKSSIKVLILDIKYELDKYEKVKNMKNLWKLSCYYYLFKINTSKDKNIENKYIIKIDEIVAKILLGEENKNYYYGILKLIFQFNQDIFESNKNEKFGEYFKVISLLNEQFFLKKIKGYMDNKRNLNLYPQYKIPLPYFEPEKLNNKLKQIYNILYVLQRTENFITNERFEYFQAFKDQNDLLNEVNYVLNKLGKKIFISLDKSNDDIREEATNYSLNIIKKRKEQEEQEEKLFNTLFKIVDEAKNAQINISKEKNDIHEKYNKLNDDYNKLNDDYKKLIAKSEKTEIDFENKINNFEKQISELKKRLIQSRTELNKQTININELNTNLIKKEDILERISYRDVGSRIITFFSCSQPENIKKAYEENNISPRNINLIANFFKDNFKNYDLYMKKNGTDLKNFLNEIKKEKKFYDYMVHDRERNLNRYIELMSANNKNLGPKIEFVFQNSELIKSYVFEKNDGILESDIFNEFKKKDEELGKQNEEFLKKAK